MQVVQRQSSACTLSDRQYIRWRRACTHRLPYCAEALCAVRTVVLEVLREARELRALRLQLLSELLVLQLQARARRSAVRELRGQCRDARIQICRRLLMK